MYVIGMRTFRYTCTRSVCTSKDLTLICIEHPSVVITQIHAYTAQHILTCNKAFRYHFSFITATHAHVRTSVSACS